MLLLRTYKLGYRSYIKGSYILKKYYILILVVVIGCVSYIGYKNLDAQEKLSKIEQLFSQIEQISVDDEIVNETIVMLRDYLEGHEIITEDIKKISQNMSVFEKEDVYIIEYKQSPELYGNSGKSSWKILKYKDDTPLIIFEENMPLELITFKLIETNSNNILFTYNENYESNHRKIQLFAYEISDDKIQKVKSLNITNLESELWMSDEDQGLIWSKNNYSIYIDNVAQNGDLIIESIDDQGTQQKLELELNEEYQYEI